MKPDLQDTIKFCEALYPEPMELPHAFGYGGLKFAKWVSVDKQSIEAVCDDIAALALTEDVYFHVCTHNPGKTSKRGNSKSALFLPAVFLDLDVAEKPDKKPQHNYPTRKAALKFLQKDCPLKPSIIVESGSGGFHVYWLMNEPLPHDEKLVKSWQSACRDWLGCDLDIRYEAARIMRLPGTIHHKHGTRVKIFEIHTARRYEPSQFLNLITPNRLKTSTSLKSNTSLRSKKGLKKEVETNESAQTILRRAGLPSYAHEPTVMLHLARRVLNIDTSALKDPGDSQKFCCILPGHEENEPSAALLWGDNNIIYKDFHRDGAALSLTKVYASQHYKKVIDNFTPTELATWLIRMLIAGSLIPPAKVSALPLPKDAPKYAEKLYSGFVHLLECRGHHSPNTPAAFAWNFARAWCGVHKQGVSEGLAWLKENGYMVKADEYPGNGRPMGLYQLGTEESVLLKEQENTELKLRPKSAMRSHKHYDKETHPFMAKNHE